MSEPVTPAADNRFYREPRAGARLGETDAAAYLGIKRSTLATFARDGRGPVFYQIGNTRQYDEDDLVRWLNEQRRGHPASAKVQAARKLAHDWLDMVRDAEAPSDGARALHDCASQLLAVTDA